MKKIIAWIKTKLGGWKQMKYSFDESKETISKAWLSCEIDHDKVNAVASVCGKISVYKDKYIDVAREIKCPWWFIACIHAKESSLDFKTCLHNGDPLPGPTTHVPSGRGPFNSWQEAAIDALKLKNFDKVTDWSIEHILYLLESYNGFGYRSKIGDTGQVELTPYVWAFTNQHDESGRYVRDGKYDKDSITKNPGAAAYIKCLERFGYIDLTRI